MKHSDYRTVFMGSPEFAVPSLQALCRAPDFSVVGVITSPPRPKGRSGMPIHTAVAAYAEQHSLPVRYSSSLKDISEQRFLSSLEPDVIVVAAFGQILSPEVLRIPRFGAINVHASLLPKYRGAAPIQNAILNGEYETGITIIIMDEGMDTGPILDQISEQILPDDTSETLGNRLAYQGGQIVVPIIKQFIEQKIQPESQPEGATITRMLKKEDGRINWRQAAEHVERMVRAYTPWPYAWTIWNKKRVRILRAKVKKSTPKERTYGTVILVGDGIGVVCGESSVLEIVELQLEGKNPQPAKEFLRGYPDVVTSVFSGEDL